MKLNALVAKYKGDLLDIATISAGQLSNGVINKTPVQFGSAKASWNASLNKPEVKNIQVENGEQVHNNNYDIANSMNLGDKFFLTNGQPYIRRLEYEGHSPQRPEGMMRVTLAEWDQIVKQAIKVSNGK